jgi:hypothetical protein
MRSDKTGQSFAAMIHLRRRHQFQINPTGPGLLGAI